MTQAEKKQYTGGGLLGGYTDRRGAGQEAMVTHREGGGGVGRRGVPPATQVTTWPEAVNQRVLGGGGRHSLHRRQRRRGGALQSSSTASQRVPPLPTKGLKIGHQSTRSLLFPPVVNPVPPRRAGSRSRPLRHAHARVPPRGLTHQPPGAQGEGAHSHKTRPAATRSRKTPPGRPAPPRTRQCRGHRGRRRCPRGGTRGQCTRRRRRRASRRACTARLGRRHRCGGAGCCRG